MFVQFVHLNLGTKFTEKFGFKIDIQMKGKRKSKKEKKKEKNSPWSALPHFGPSDGTTARPTQLSLARPLACSPCRGAHASISFNRARTVSWISPPCGPDTDCRTVRRRSIGSWGPIARCFSFPLAVRNKRCAQLVLRGPILSPNSAQLPAPSSS